MLACGTSIPLVENQITSTYISIYIYSLGRTLMPVNNEGKLESQPRILWTPKQNTACKSCHHKEMNPRILGLGAPWAL